MIVYDSVNGKISTKYFTKTVSYWSGHKFFLGRPQGLRRRGRPKLRWQDGVEESAIKAGITDWHTKARNRERFRTLLRQAKTAKRL